MNVYLISTQSMNVQIQANVKIMVKALEEIAEEEQKALIEEEKQAAEKLAAIESDDKRKDTTIGASDVETPRSYKDGSDKEQEDNSSSSKKKPNKTAEETKKDKTEQPKDSYGIDAMKFGNAAIRSKNNGTHSPLLGDRQFAHLITIEEDKNET